VCRSGLVSRNREPALMSFLGTLGERLGSGS
jgi:hypothetical protein